MYVSYLDIVGSGEYYLSGDGVDEVGREVIYS